MDMRHDFVPAEPGDPSAEGQRLLAEASARQAKTATARALAAARGAKRARPPGAFARDDDYPA